MALLCNRLRISRHCASDSLRTEGDFILDTSYSATAGPTHGRKQFRHDIKDSTVYCRVTISEQEPAFHLLMADHEPRRAGQQTPNLGSAKRGTNTRVACLPCQKAKVKCDGVRPRCSRCQSKGTRCEYSMEEEERSSRFVRAESKRKTRELDSLWRIIRKLQDEDEEEAFSFLRHLRRTDNPLELAAELQTARASSRGESASSSQNIRETSQEQPTSHGVEAEFEALKFTSAGLLGRKYSQLVTPTIPDTSESLLSPWTAGHWADIVADQRRVNEHIARYLTWQHAIFECFPEQHFREDLRAGHGEYYSPLLVHAICATSCLISEGANAHNESMQHYGQATILFEQRPGPSLSTLAAISLLCHIEHGRGHLSSMWLLSGQMTRMIQDIGLHLRKSDSDAHSLSDETATSKCFWGTMFTDVLISLSLARLPSMPTSAITRPHPQIEQAQDVHDWTNDDFFMKPKPGMRSSTFSNIAALGKLINSTLYMFFAPTHEISALAIITEHSKYLSWFDHLSPGLANLIDAPPHVLHLHMQYHSAVLLLFRPFLSAKFVDFPGTDPRHIAMIAAQNISHAFQEHYRQYHHTGVCTLHVHALLTACTIHILNLANQESLQGLISACKNFWVLAPRIKWASASLQIVQGLATRWSIILPPEVMAVLDIRSAESMFSFATTDQANSYLTHKLAFQPPNSYPSAQDRYTPFPNQSPPLSGPFPRQGDDIPFSTQAFSGQADVDPLVSGIKWGDEGWMSNLVFDSVEAELSQQR